METFYQGCLSLLINRKCGVAGDPLELAHPWPQLNNDVTPHLLRVILSYSPLKTFMALLSAFPLLQRDVSIVSDGQTTAFAPGVKAISISSLLSNTGYDQKPLVVFVLQNVGAKAVTRIGLFEMLLSYSHYFTPSSFISMEVPNMQCFQLGLIDHFAKRRGATILPPITNYRSDIWHTYKCLREAVIDTPAANLLPTTGGPAPPQERLLVEIPSGIYQTNNIFHAGGGSYYCIDVVDDVVDLERLQSANYMSELRAHFNRCCSEKQCCPNRIFLPTKGKDMQRMCVTFRGWDVPDILHPTTHSVHRWLFSDRSFTLANLDWSPQNFHGHSCPRYHEHWKSDLPTFAGRLLQGPVDFTEGYKKLFYVGVPIETVLKTNFHETEQLVWKRVTRIEPYELQTVGKTPSYCGFQVQFVQDFLSPRFRNHIHPYHTVWDGKTVEIQTPSMKTLKIWSHLNELEPLPVFIAPELRTLVLVALNNSTIRWDVNCLLEGDCYFPAACIRKAVIAVLGDVGQLSDGPMLKWNEYSVLAPNVISLTVIGYVLDKLVMCGDNLDIKTKNTHIFARLETLSIDVTHFPLTTGKQGQEILDITLSASSFPKIEHLDLSGAPTGSLNFSVLHRDCHTEIHVPESCASVMASTSLAANPVVINGDLMGTGGQDHIVRDGRWRVKWIRCWTEFWTLREEFVYKETFRLPIDPDIVEMSEM